MWSRNAGRDTVLTLIGCTLRGTQGGKRSGGIGLDLYNVAVYYDGPPADLFQTSLGVPKGSSYDVTFENNYNYAIYLTGSYWLCGR